MFKTLLRTTVAGAVLALAVGKASASNLTLVAGPGTHFGASVANSGFGFAGVTGGATPYLFVYETGGGFSTYFDATVGPYDGADDTEVAVYNASGLAQNSLTLTSSSDIFGFDGDGINTFGAPGNGSDNTGYGGPKTFFTGINPAATTGTANFIGGLATGTSTYFSLEEAPNAIGGQGIQVGGVPEPASITMLGMGVASLLGYGWRRRKQAAAA